jgi:NADPH-dependent curcumin reductase CurA
MSTNKQIILASRPQALPTVDNFSIVESPLPQPMDGELLLRTLYISVDPYMRGRMNDRKSYVPPFQVGKVITGGTVSQVVESKSDGFKKGDIVVGSSSWALFSTVEAAQATKINPDLAPISTALSILGMTGLTAYFGLLDIGQPKVGETVVVSGAAGAVGMIVGQIAKLKGARVIGIAGSEEKRDYLINELGFDAAVNYKTSTDIAAELREACPNGVDVYFDNVGGRISDAVLSLVNKYARIPVCGQISMYNSEQVDVGPRVQGLLITYSVLMKGFTIGDYAPRFPEGITQLTQWLVEGKLKYAENIIDGFENTPQAFLGLFAGENLGKQVVKVADPSWNSQPIEMR